VPQPWRLLVDGVGSGPWNMAVDEALLASVTDGGLPVLRFYQWNGPWLSLGYRQRLDAERLTACAHTGVGVVRRSTGGRAVLHGEDLTYAVVAREDALPAGLAATYAVVSAALRQALVTVGVAAEPAPRPAAVGRAAVFDCFAEPAADELCVGGLKLIGSAQRRAGGGVLQHGSIRLDRDPTAVRIAAGFAPGAATSLSELGVEIEVASLITACRSAFAGCLNADFDLGSIAPSELQTARDREISRTRDFSVSRAIPRGEPQECNSTADREDRE
jgi:lipoate-protein ligase A